MFIVKSICNPLSKDTAVDYAYTLGVTFSIRNSKKYFHIIKKQWHLFNNILQYTRF